MGGCREGGSVCERERKTRKEKKRKEKKKIGEKVKNGKRNRQSTSKRRNKKLKEKTEYYFIKTFEHERSSRVYLKRRKSIIYPVERNTVDRGSGSITIRQQRSDVLYGYGYGYGYGHRTSSI